MTTLRQIITDWQTASGTGKVSVMYFDATPTVGSQRTALHTFLGAVDANLDNSVNWTIRTSGIEVDDATGTLTGAWTEPTPASGTGAGTGEPLADATQMLIRWKTATIVNGRFLQGRTYIPGVGNGNTVGGNLASSVQTATLTAANTFIASVAGLSVWHRPIAGSGGSSDLVTAADVWQEFAVLRKRRG